MTEKLLQFIWQFQYFNKSQLTVGGESLEIIYPGAINNDQGPDFSNAQIRIGGTVLAGSIELHLKTSNWFDHGHHLDGNYKNVILHVVYEDNSDAVFPLPLVELQSRIPKVLLDRYASLMNTTSFISCQGSIMKVKEITWEAWKDRLVAERLTRKATVVFQYLKENNAHWEETFWWLIARNFGIKVNADAFENMARSISIRVLARHKNQIHQLEALLLGQCGLLVGGFAEEYVRLLQREYVFLQKKYLLKPITLPIHFLRMRPANFPTIRLAQLAMLIHQSVHLFSIILEAEDVEEVSHLLKIEPNDYWKYHYLPDKPSTYQEKKLGGAMIENILINTIVPVLFAYGAYHGEEKYKDKALRWLENINQEKNAIIRSFQLLEVKSKSAFDTQSLIELKTRYCDGKRCLQCAVGNSLLKDY